MMRTLQEAIYRPGRKIPEKCTLCAQNAPYFGSLDFAVSGNDFFAGRRMFKDTGVPVDYFRCLSCEYLFTSAFKNFTNEDYGAFVYNDSYIDADPPFLEERPLRDAKMCSILLHPFKTTVTILDYGCGTGLMAQTLKQKGFQAGGIDPLFQPSSSEKPQADIVTCFEVVEHVYDQYGMMCDVAALLAPNGVFLFSTQLQPPNIEDLGINWWYIMPRNAHMSMHSRKSLSHLMAETGFEWHQLCDDLFLAWRAPGTISQKILSDTAALEKIKAFRNPLPQKNA